MVKTQSGVMKLYQWILFSLSFPLLQITGQPSEQTEEDIQANISVYIWAKGTYGDLFDKDGNLTYKYTPPEVKMAGTDGRVIDLDVFPNRRTSFHNYKGSPSLKFFKEVQVEGNPELQKQIIAQISLPTTTKSALLLFYPSDQAMSTFNIYPLLNVSESIPSGKAMVFNTCPFNIGAQFGTEPAFEMKPQERLLADLRPKDYFLQYQFWVPNQNEWKKAYSSKKSVDPESSLILIVHPRMNSDGTVNPRLIDMLSLSAL